MQLAVEIAAMQMGVMTYELILVEHFVHCWSSQNNVHKNLITSPSSMPQVFKQLCR